VDPHRVLYFLALVSAIGCLPCFSNCLTNINLSDMETCSSFSARDHPVDSHRRRIDSDRTRNHGESASAGLRSTRLALATGDVLRRSKKIGGRMESGRSGVFQYAVKKTPRSELRRDSGDLQTPSQETPVGRRPIADFSRNLQRCGNEVAGCADHSCNFLHHPLAEVS